MCLVLNYINYSLIMSKFFNKATRKKCNNNKRREKNWQIKKCEDEKINCVNEDIQFRKNYGVLFVYFHKKADGKCSK